MAITLSHLSALDVTRTLRSKGVNLRDMDTVSLSHPTPWVGKRWRQREFDPSVWQWERPTRTAPLHVVVPKRGGRRRVGMDCVVVHEQSQSLPPQSIVWLDEHTSMVCPELLFLQMANCMSLPALVMLGHELCGHFSRTAQEPLEGDVTTNVPAATNAERLINYVSAFSHMHGIKRARFALSHMSDHALSAPESVLGMMYSLPPEEGGFGMGPVTFNLRVSLEDLHEPYGLRARYPDLSFSFAPLGINYDGEGHLDLDALINDAKRLALVTSDVQEKAQRELGTTKAQVRAKYVDDIVRNRQLASRGRIVFPATKEDLRDADSLDELTRQILGCARTLFGIDTSRYDKTLEDTEEKHERSRLLASVTPLGRQWGSSHGRM